MIDASAGRRASMAAMAFVITVYLVTFALLPRGGFWINDNGLKFIQLRSIVASGYRDYAIRWPGAEMDPGYDFRPIRGPFGYLERGRLFAQYSPFFPLVSSFPYRVFGMTGLYVLPLLGAFFTLTAVSRLAGRLAPSPPARRWARLLAVLIAGLATPLWFYSMTFWEHMPAVALVLGSAELLVRYVTEGGKRRLILSAILCGLSVYFRDELYLYACVAAVVLGYRAPRRWRDGLTFVTVAGLATIPLLVFQWQTLGHPLGFHFTPNSPLHSGLETYLRERWPVARNLLLSAHTSGWVSALVSGPGLLLLLLNPRLREDRYRRVFALVGAATLTGGLLVLFGFLRCDRPVEWLIRSNGLFAASPVLLFGLLRRGRSRDHPDRAGSRPGVGLRVLRDGVLLYALAYVLIVPEINAVGVHWGCRFLVHLYPMLAVLAAVSIAEWWQPAAGPMRPGQALVTLVLLLSVATQIYSLTLLERRKAFSERLNREVLASPEPTVASANWFVPQTLALAFHDKSVFLVSGPDEIPRFLDLLRRRGERQILWVLSPPEPGEPHRRRRILSDGLGFTTVELRSVAVQLEEPVD